MLGTEVMPARIDSSLPVRFIDIKNSRSSRLPSPGPPRAGRPITKSHSCCSAANPQCSAWMACFWGYHWHGQEPLRKRKCNATGGCQELLQLWSSRTGGGSSDRCRVYYMIGNQWRQVCGSSGFVRGASVSTWPLAAAISRRLSAASESRARAYLA